MFLFFCIVLIYPNTNLSAASKYYISTTGNDGNNGTSSGTPKLTLANVFLTYNLGTGDTIFVAAGTYTETGITVGTDDEAFVIEGAALSSGSPTSIFDAASTNRWLLLGNTNNDNIKINKLTIKDHKQSSGSGPNEGGGGIKVITGATGLVVKYCVFDNCDSRTNSSQNDGGAIYSQEGFTVSYCTFKNCNAEYYGGAIATTVSPTTNSQIDHCTFFSNTASNYGGAVFIGTSASHTVTMYNCLFYSNQTSGEATIVAMSSTSTINITNCTITNNGNGSAATGGVLALSSGVINIVNSIVYNNIGTGYSDIYNNTSTITMKNSFYLDQNSVSLTAPNSTSDPLFTNSASDDYTLQVTSPAIDYGTTTGAPTDDIRHYSRISNPDVGAFESNGTPLPIELIYFKLEKEARGVSIEWATATEKNNAYFLIERSKDAVNFEVIVKIDGSGDSRGLLNYNFIDQDVQEGIHYYRLKQVDLNGRYSYSKLNSINVFDFKSSTPLIYPNPVTSNEFYIQYDGDARIELFSILGLRLSEEFYDIEKVGMDNYKVILKKPIKQICVVVNNQLNQVIVDGN